MLDTNTYRWIFIKAHSDVQDDDRMEGDNMESSRSLPYQRYGHTVCAYRGRAYLWGGRNDDYGASSTLHEFDPMLLRWRVVPVEGRVPPARDGHSAVVVGDRMYLFGGFEEDLQRFSQETYVFDFQTNRWSELNTTGQPPLWRDFHTAVAINSKMYIFGGRSDHTGQFHSTRDMYDERLKALDLRTGEWSEPICSGVSPTGRRSHSAWTYGGKMYIFGGYLGTQNMHYDDLFSFDPSTNHWEKIKTSGRMPSARRRQCTVVVDSRVFLFGGTMPVKNPSGTPSGLADLADLYVLDYAPSLKHLAAGVVLRHNLHKTYADHIPLDLSRELWAMTTPNAISTPFTQRHDALG
ncbi:kelch repeat protein [Dictyocaulus viviparus]|uniref:Kelch repeat protein n=1 Tax=Dictyocaulus viviparus TaxID=29172 RepID=A0A0D8YCG6_DICVI|nr:kelch repeat protein [Dictyocaulus viviparus]